MKRKSKISLSVFSFAVMLMGLTVPALGEEIQLSSLRNIVAGASQNANTSNISRDSYTGWQVNTNGKFSYYEDGALQTGWLKVDGDWYYLDSFGIPKTGWFKDDSEKWYYFENSGKMVHNGTINYSGKLYFFDSSGRMI